MKSLSEALHKKNKDRRPVSIRFIAESFGLVGVPGTVIPLRTLIRLLELEPPLSPINLTTEIFAGLDLELSWDDPGSGTLNEATKFHVHLQAGENLILDKDIDTGNPLAPFGPPKRTSRIQFQGNATYSWDVTAINNAGSAVSERIDLHIP